VTAFDRLVWESDSRVRVGAVEFALPAVSELGAEDRGRPGFRLQKDRSIIEAYERYWTEARPGFAPRNLFELGIWDGASVALWFELWRPECHVGVDIEDRRSADLDAYLDDPERSGRVFLHWDVDQSDRSRLRRIADAHVEGPLDLVIDDASHLYAPTKASLETLLPLLRPGGLYVIEDWAWGHWGNGPHRLHPVPGREAPTPLVVELLAAAGTSDRAIAAVDVRRHFVVVERGPGELDPAGFRLDRERAWSGSGPVARPRARPGPRSIALGIRRPWRRA
jgi:SAM-dependent methyltransferase